MNIERLVQMANDIANYFAVEPEQAEAVAGVAGHIRRFWDPSMRRQLLDHVQGGGAGLSDLALAAARQLGGAAPAT